MQSMFFDGDVFEGPFENRFFDGSWMLFEVLENKVRNLRSFVRQQNDFEI